MQTKEYFDEYYQKNKEKILKKQKEYYNNVGKTKRVKYNEDNRERINEYYRIYHKKRRKELGISERVNEGKVSWMKKIIKRDGAFCKKCKTTKDLTLQHIKPRCIGGEYSYDNLEILCQTCNIKDYHQLVKKALTYYFKNK